MTQTNLPTTETKIAGSTDSSGIYDNIRRMTESDRQAVMEMMRVFYASEAVLSNGSDEIFSSDITACVSDSPFAEGFIFTLGGPDREEIAGYAMLAHSYSTEFGKRCVWIEDLYLLEKARGLGLASQFLDYLNESYPDALHRLEAEDENEHAVEIYKSKGFRKLPYIEMIRQ